jgi:NTE family protein
VTAPEVLRGISPVRRIPTDAVAEPQAGTGLCLSGGGYRAMLFHAGALIRLNQAGLLGRLDRVSSVSGGSILAGKLALEWDRLTWKGGVAADLGAKVIAPVRELARRTIDISSVVEGKALPFADAGDRLAGAYREHLFGDATLADLPAAPRFVLCATNLESGALFRFTRDAVADWRVGRVRDPDIPLADAAAASSAFPPVLSPFDLDFRDATWEDEAGNDLTAPGYRGRLLLTDGGVYDNLGLEAVWKKCRTVLVSDAGGELQPDDSPSRLWGLQLLRVTRVIDHQVRALRKHQVVASLAAGTRDGAYWGIRSDTASFGLGDPLPVDPAQARVLAAVPTRLKELADPLQMRLMNWGYVICDTAVRRWVDPAAPRPAGVPYPEAPIA